MRHTQTERGRPAPRARARVNPERPRVAACGRCVLGALSAVANSHLYHRSSKHWAPTSGCTMCVCGRNYTRDYVVATVPEASRDAKKNMLVQPSCTLFPAM
eukprot:349934-Chlamydomonas_euryale.AAC.4